MADKEELCDVVEEAIRWSGGVHALVTSAGIVRRDGEGVYQEIFSVNVLGSMNSIEALRRNFEERRGGTIVMVGSIVGSHGWPERVVYCASKGAVEAGMRAYAMEFAKLGVRVNAVAPGLVWTPLMKKVVQGEPDAEQAFRFRAAQQALGAMLAPEDVAKHILFLASDLSSGILGATLDASGGRLAGHVPNTEHLGPHFEARWEEIKKEF